MIPALPMSFPSEFSAPTPEALAALLPAYDFEMLIAKGGMGAVYKARQRSLDRDVAIKIMPHELVEDPDFRKSFETEARAMARLNHPNLIAVYDSGEVGGMPYLVMEFVPGKSLYHSAYGRKIEPVQAVELTLGICKGLAHAHESGILHRDIKPANILLNKKAEPKIGDFGLAHPMESDGPGLVMGTPGYTAPEVMRQPEKSDRRSDLYSVGVILYELLTGKRQEGDSPPPSVAVGVDVALDNIWRRATNSNPGLRYPDGHAFALDLEAWLKKQPAVGIPGPPTTASLARKPGPPIRMPAQRQDDETSVVGKSGSGMFVNFLLLAVLALGGYFGWKKLSQPAEPAPTVEAPAETTTPGAIDSAAARPGSGKSGTFVPSSPFGTPAGGGGSGTTSPFGSTSPYANNNGGGTSPGQSASSGSGSSPSHADPSSEPLAVKARELIAAAEADRNKALVENVHRFNWDLDAWFRNLSKAEQGNWQTQVDGLKASVRNSRVPLSVPDGSRIKLSGTMAKTATYAADKQKEIDSAYLAKVTRYHDLYVPKLRDALAESEKNGATAAAQNQRLLLQDATDLNVWVRSFGGDTQPENPSLEVKKLDPSDKSTFFGIPVK